MKILYIQSTEFLVLCLNSIKRLYVIYYLKSLFLIFVFQIIIIQVITFRVSQFYLSLNQHYFDTSSIIMTCFKNIWSIKSLARLIFRYLISMRKIKYFQFKILRQIHCLWCRYVIHYVVFITNSFNKTLFTSHSHSTCLSLSIIYCKKK
jgi:hypothetical protein